MRYILNRHNLLALIESVRATETFDMARYLKPTLKATHKMDEPPCGTACCIAGHAIMLEFQEVSYLSSRSFTVDGKEEIMVAQRAAEWLGLSPDVAWWLFYGDWHQTATLRDLSKSQAIHALEYLLLSSDDSLQDGAFSFPVFFKDSL